MKVSRVTAERYYSREWFLWLCSKIEKYIVSNRASKLLNHTDKYSVSNKNNSNSQYNLKKHFVGLDMSFYSSRYFTETLSLVDQIMEKNPVFPKIMEVYLDSKYFADLPFIIRRLQKGKIKYGSTLSMDFNYRNDDEFLEKLYDLKISGSITEPRSQGLRYSFINCLGKDEIVDSPMLSVKLNMPTLEELTDTHMERVFDCLKEYSVKRVFANVMLDSKTKANGLYTLSYVGRLILN